MEHLFWSSIDEVCGELDQREPIVLKYRIPFYGQQRRTLEFISTQILGVSREWIRRLEKRGRDNLNSKIYQRSITDEDKEVGAK